MMCMIVRKSRNELIDIMRGFSIFLVVLGHSIQYTTMQGDFFENNLFKFIYSFHMPLLMLISGYLAYNSIEKRTFFQNITNKFRSLAHPMIVWGAILTFLQILVIGTINIRSWFLNSIGIWFLYSLLINYIGLSLTYLLKHYEAKLLAIILWGGGLVVLPSSSMLLYMYPYFLIGFFVAQRDYITKWTNLPEKAKCVIFIVMIIAFEILFISFDRDTYIYTSGINPFNSSIGVSRQIVVDIKRYFIGVVGSFEAAVCISTVYRKQKNLKIWSILAKFGRISLQIYLLQKVLLETMGAKLYGYACKYIGVEFGTITSTFIIAPVICSVMLFTICLLVKYIQKSKVLTSVLFGK